MGNSKHSTVSSKTASFQEHSKTLAALQMQGRTRHRMSSEDDYADSQLGRLRSVDFRLGNVLLQSGALSSARTDGFLLDNLRSPNTFLFARTCQRDHKGFGFSTEIAFESDGGESGKYVVQQMAKPKKRFQGFEDSPLDVFDLRPEFQRQVLGLVFKKRESEAENALEGMDVFSIQGLIGSILIKGDWTTAYEVRNSEDEAAFLAQRFNRISGGLEFQIYSVSTKEVPVCIATLVRLEESKFILKIYTSCSPSFKSLLISLTLFMMYLWSR